MFTILFAPAVAKHHSPSNRYSVSKCRMEPASRQEKPSAIFYIGTARQSPKYIARALTLCACVIAVLAILMWAKGPSPRIVAGSIAVSYALAVSIAAYIYANFVSMHIAFGRNSITVVRSLGGVSQFEMATMDRRDVTLGVAECCPPAERWSSDADRDKRDIIVLSLGKRHYGIESLACGSGHARATEISDTIGVLPANELPVRYWYER